MYYIANVQSMHYFVGGSKRASCFLTAALLLVAVAMSSSSSPFSITDLRGQEADLAGGENNDRVLKRSSARDEPRRVAQTKYYS